MENHTKVEFLSFKQFFELRKTDSLIFSGPETSHLMCDGWISKPSQFSKLKSNVIYDFNYVGKAKKVCKTMIFFRS